MSYCLSVVAGAVGTNVDETKTREFQIEMVILGLERKSMSIRLPGDKAHRWLHIIREALRAGTLCS